MKYSLLVACLLLSSCIPEGVVFNDLRQAYLKGCQDAKGENCDMKAAAFTENWREGK